MKNFEQFLVEAKDPKPKSKPKPKAKSKTSKAKPKRKPKPKVSPLTDGNLISDDIVIVPGRFNPPHFGHGLTMDYASNLADSIGDNMPADQSFYASKTQDPKKNPLPFELKIDFLKKMFPAHAEKWDDNLELRTIMDIAMDLDGKGYKNLHVVGRQDRRQMIEDLLRKYNGQLYNFKNIYSHSSGDGSDENNDFSGSKQRRLAMNGDFDKFKEGIKLNKKTFKVSDARKLFDFLRMFMVKNEEWLIDSVSHRELLFEMYKDERLFKPGDLVEHDITGLTGKVHRCGANHVICLTEDGVCFKSFVHQLSYLNT